MKFAAAMDASVWFLLISGLIVAAQAGPADRGPPVFSDGDPTPKQQQKRQENFSVFPEGNPAPKQQEKRQQNYAMFSKSNSIPKKQEKQQQNLAVLSEGSPNPKQQQKRQQNYEMKEVILYLTPTQIRALEAEQGLIEPQQSSQPDLEPLKQQIAEQIQNALNAEGQSKQNQMEKAKDADRKQRLRLHEAIQNKPSAGSQQPQLPPENKVPQLPPHNELPKIEKNSQIPQLQLSLLPPGLQLEPQEDSNIQVDPQLLSQLKYQFKPQEVANIQLDPQLLLQFKQQFKLQEAANIQPNPQSLLHLKPQEDANIQLDPQLLSQLKQQFKPHEDANIQLDPRLLLHLKQQLISSHLPHIQPLKLIPEAVPQLEPHNLYHDKKQWHPQNYAYLYFYPKGKHINTEHLFYPDHHELLQAERLKPIIPTEHLPVQPLHPNFELVPYDYGLQNKLEAQQILQAQLNEHHLEPHFLKEHKLESQQLSKEVDIQQLLAEKHLEPQFLYPRHQEAYQQAQRQEEAHRDNKVLQDKHEHKKQNLEAQKFDPGLAEYFKEQMKEVEEAQNLKKKIEAEEKEAHRLDAQLEEEQRKTEEMKQENEEIEYLRSITELEPKRSKMYSILKPLFQGHNIAEFLEEQKKNFPHHIISMEHGFKPLQYAPKYNDEKYAKEVEKMLHRNVLAKQKALATAAAIANEPPQIIETENKEVIKHVTVPMPTPVFVPVPQPVEVNVPQPYPVPLEIVNHVPIPIMKTEKVEVEKPVPIEIEKHVPYPVMKKVYVKVDKPYFVEKVVPVEVKKEIPVLRPQKLSIIRHVWET